MTEQNQQQTPTSYNQTNNQTATYGEQSSSVLSLQKMLNDKYHAGLELDSKYGPKTQDAYNKYIKNAGTGTAPSPDLKPRVTPTNTPTLTPPVSGDGTGTPFKTAEDKTYQDLLKRSSGLLGSINQKYKDELKTSDAAAMARTNAGGLSGSTAGGRIVSEAEQPILDAREADLQTVYSNIEQLAHQYTQENLTNAKDAVSTMAKNHLDWQAYKQTNPKNYQALVDSLGGDPNYADALFASSIPPANIVQTWVNGSTQFQLTQDPITGKPSIQQYDLGIKVPQSWMMDKIGTNSVIYHSANWDPTDPSTYQMFAVDPLTGIPTKQVGGTPNGSSTPPAAPRVASLIDPNFTDTSISLSQAIDTYGIGAVINGIKQNEGGSLAGVENNPGNIKFAGISGQIDSGVKAADGGTFASYATKNDGEMGIYNLIQKGIASGKSFGDFINAYTGTSGGTSAPTTNPAIQGALQVYKATGQIPSFGYGASGAAMKRQFYAALAQDQGIVGEAVGNKAEVAGATAALRTQENQYAANQTSIGTLDGQLALVQKYSDKVDRSDSPLVNKFILWKKGQVSGDADTAALNNIITTASNEFAKILSGSSASIAGVTVSSAEDAKNMLNAALSKGQLNEVLRLMKTESQLRLTNQKDTIDQLRGDIKNIVSNTSSDTTTDTGSIQTIPDAVSNFLSSEGIDATTLSADQISQLESALGL